MDTFAAMALATEAPTEDLLLQKPYSRSDSIFTPVMFRNIIGQAIY
jgi:magnesium-transporting ATPase (P-type)